MNRKALVTDVVRSVDLLRKQVNLPAVPLEVVFEQVPRGTPGGLGPVDYVLVAVMRFDKATLKHLVDMSAQRPDSSPRISATTNRAWFPAEVKAAIAPYDEKSFVVQGRKFDAASFLRPPYATGYIVVIDGSDYIILTAQTS